MRIELPFVYGEFPMSGQSFRELTNQLEKELFRSHYTKNTVAAYRRMWKRISIFLEREGSEQFTEEAGLRFLDTALFYNRQHGKISRAGISYILSKYVVKAREQ